MKRRLLSAFLAVMMVLTMAPVAFAADTATSDGEALSKLFTDVHAGESGSGNVTVTIDKDYDLTGYQWTSLTVQGYTGAGVVTVEGNNHKITGLNAPLFAGGFAGTSGIVVKNLTLTNVNIKDSTSDQGIGAFINNIDSMPKIELDNCHLTDSSIDSNGGARVGGLIGWTSGYNNPNDGPVDTYVTIQNCSVENTEITAKGSVGGIIGHAGANPATYHTFTNNTVTGCTLNSTDDGGWRVGVVVGTANVGEVTITGTKESNNNLTQTGKTAPEGQSNLYGRFVPNGTGKLVIDDEASFGTDYVAAVGTNGYKTVAAAVAEADGKTVTLLKDVTEDVVIPADKTVTLNLNGKKLTNVASHTIFNNGTLTINGEGTVDNVTHGKAALVNYGTAMLNNGVTLKRSSEKGTLVPYNNGGNSYYTILNDKGATMTINNATVENSGGYSSAICNGGDPQCNKELYLTINDGNFSGGINTVKNDGLGILTINGGTFSNSSQYVVMNWHKAEFHGTATFSANAMAEAVLFTSSYDNSPIMAGELKVFDGYYKAATDKQALIRDHYDADNKGTAIISGGYFTTDPSAYCVTGKTGVKSDKDGYKYKVGTIEVKDENEIKTDTQKGTTQATLGDKIAAGDETAATAVGTSVTPTKLTDTTPITADDKAQALTELVKNNKVKLTDDGKIPAGTTVTVVKKTYLDVTVTTYDTTSDTVSMDIVPKYDLIAVAKNGNSAAEQIVLKSAQDAKVGSTEVEVTLPNEFKGKKVYINHNNGANLYVATADKTTGKVKFTTNGFSPFTFALTNPGVVAEVNGNAYKSLQDAANAANNGDEITVVKNANHDLTFNTTKSVKVTNKTTGKITVKFNGTDKEIDTDKTETFSYTKPSSGSSGGSSSGKTTYKVTTSAVNNGGVNASPSNAEKGATITITLSPDKGYKLDKLTVTDGSGKTVSTVKKSDTVYTFTMPASAVKVGVSYVKATETPSEIKFNDVSANDWFASAVDYVTGKGMMNGTADNTFSPKANTTRGMVVTVLYRLENQPSTSAASFTDVASGAYYANAVAWANANGIVSGYGSGKFGPNDKVTREQLAAILYRYAQYKKYDVSVGEDTNILSYNDAQSISSYAIPAIQWACGAGVVTGKSGSKLDPKGNATRAEVAAMLMRFCENVK